MSRRYLPLVITLLCGVVLIGACGKKNPTGPTMPDNPQMVASPTPDLSRSTVLVKAVCGTNPLSNIACNLQFEGGTAKLQNTDSTGTTTFTDTTEGNFSATVPAQVDILETTLSGYVKRGQTNTTVFQAGGAISLTPTAIQYEKVTGGTYKIIATYNRGAYSLKTRLNISLVNLPAAWSASFSAPVIVDGQSTTLTVSVPAGSGENATNLIIRGNANGAAIQIDSQPLKIFCEWASFKVKVTHHNTAWSNIPITVYDSNNSPYYGSTNEWGECSFTLNALGSYTVDVYSPTNGIDHSIKTGTVVQGVNPDVYFNGEPGTVTVTPGDVNYIYEAGNYQNTITYTGTGDLKYKLNLTHTPVFNPIGGAGNITQGFSQSTITAGQTVYSNYHVVQGCTATHACQIIGTKPGTNGFTKPVSYNINSDWWVRPVLSCGTTVNMYKLHAWEDEWYSNQNIAYTIEGHNVPANASIIVTETLVMPQSWPFPGWAGSGQLGLPGWKYWHSNPDPNAHNMTPRENNSIWTTTKLPGATVSYQIHGYRNPYYGENLSGDGLITIRASYGEKTGIKTILLNY